MIESRYKIEYILPDEDVKKTSPFRVLWYLLLIPLIALAVAFITYDFSFKDLSRDSLVLAEKAKVHIFNLGSTQEPNNLQKITNQVAKNTVKAKTASDVTKKPSTQVASKAVIDQDKIRTPTLSPKQVSQLKAIEKQISENSALTQKLNKLSQQFVLEQVKNQQLNSKLAEQEKDRIELEEQLNQMLESSVDNKTDLEKISIPNNKESLVVLEPKVTESEDAVLIQTPEVAQTPKKEIEAVKAEQSETDKIIQAMTTIAIDKTPKIEKSAVEIKAIKELVSQPKIEVKSLEKTNNSTVVNDTPTVSSIDNEEVKENKEPSASVTKNLVTKEKSTNAELAIKEKEEEKEPDTKVEAISQTPSAVDAIIAAMQSSQSNTNNSNNIKNPANTKQNTDPMLEKNAKK